MSDLYGCHFAVTIKTKDLIGWIKKDRWFCVFVTRYEVGGQRTPGSPVLIYSDGEEDLKQRDSQPRHFWQVILNHQGCPCGSRVSMLNHSSRCFYVSDSFLTEKQEKQDINIWLRPLKMYIYLCLNMEEVSRVSETYEGQPLIYPSLLTVRFGTVWQNFITYLNTSVTEFKGRV